MSIATAITTAQGRVAAAYTACNGKGATMPSASNQNLSHLADTISSISVLPTGWVSGGVIRTDEKLNVPNGIVNAAFTPLIDMTGRNGHSIIFCWGIAYLYDSGGTTTENTIVLYQNADGTGSINGYTGTIGMSRTVDSYNGSYLSCRMVLCLDYLEYAFIYDNTSSEYLFKGSDYVTRTYPSLPTGYTNYDYLQCDGSAYIDSGITAAYPMSLYAKFAWFQTTGDYIFVGARQDSGNTRFFPLAVNATTINIGYGTYSNTGTSFSTAFSNGYPVVVRTILAPGEQVRDVIVKDTGTELRWNGTTAGEITTTKTLHIFRLNYSSVYHVPSGTRLYELKLYDDASLTHLVFHGVPCTNQYGTPGLYELVNGTFLSNSGSGSFTAGNDI